MNECGATGVLQRGELGQPARALSRPLPQLRRSAAAAGVHPQLPGDERVTGAAAQRHGP